MTLLPEFPSMGWIYGALVTLIIVNAITAGIAMWAMRDIRDHREQHRIEIGQLRSALASLSPKTSCLPPVVIGGEKFATGDWVYFGGVPAVVASDPGRSDAGKVQVEYLHPDGFDILTEVVYDSSLCRRAMMSRIDRIVMERPRPLHE